MYLSTMFQISDVLVDKDEVAMVLEIPLSFQDNDMGDSESKMKIAVQNRTWKTWSNMFQNSCQHKDFLASHVQKSNISYYHYQRTAGM